MDKLLINSILFIHFAPTQAKLNPNINELSKIKFINQGISHLPEPDSEITKKLQTLSNGSWDDLERKDLIKIEREIRTVLDERYDHLKDYYDKEIQPLGEVKDDNVSALSLDIEQGYDSVAKDIHEASSYMNWHDDLTEVSRARPPYTVPPWEGDRGYPIRRTRNKRYFNDLWDKDFNFLQLDLDAFQGGPLNTKYEWKNGIPQYGVANPIIYAHEKADAMDFIGPDVLSDIDKRKAKFDEFNETLSIRNGEMREFLKKKRDHLDEYSELMAGIPSREKNAAVQRYGPDSPSGDGDQSKDVKLGDLLKSRANYLNKNINGNGALRGSGGGNTSIVYATTEAPYEVMAVDAVEPLEEFTNDDGVKKEPSAFSIWLETHMHHLEDTADSDSDGHELLGHLSQWYDTTLNRPIFWYFTKEPRFNNPHSDEAVLPPGYHHRVPGGTSTTPKPIKSPAIIINQEALLTEDEATTTKSPILEELHEPQMQDQRPGNLKKAIEILQLYKTEAKHLTPYNLENAKNGIVEKLNEVEIQLPEGLINEIVQSPRQIMEAINILGIDRDSVV